MAFLPDANIYLRLVNGDDPQQPAASAALSTLVGRGEDLILVPQTIMEFWRAATAPSDPDHNGLGLSVGRAANELRGFQQFFTFRPEPLGLFPVWLDLVMSMGITGRQIYDARVAAIMRVLGISHILTFNADDFRRYPGITVVHPSEL